MAESLENLSRRAGNKHAFYEKPVLDIILAYAGSDDAEPEKIPELYKALLQARIDFYQPEKDKTS